MLGRSALLIRNASKSLVRKHGDYHGTGGVPGENLPFQVGGNPYRLTAVFIIFFGSAFGLPFFTLRHHLTK